jgi:alpha-glucosidase
MYDAIRFWLNRGVAGFRLDAVSRLFEDPNLHDDPIVPGKNAYGDPKIVHKYTDNLPEIHEVLREMRRVVDAYPGNPVLISEANVLFQQPRCRRRDFCEGTRERATHSS